MDICTEDVYVRKFLKNVYVLFSFGLYIFTNGYVHKTINKGRNRKP